MKLSDNAEKQKSLEVAEAARETVWEHPSFVAGLFKGEFNWEHVHPFPLQSEADKKIGDEFLAKLEVCLRKHIDPDQIDATYEIPQHAVNALAELGCFGMKIPKKYGGLGLTQTNYNRAVAMVGSFCASTAVLLSAHQSIGVPQPLMNFGTEEQKEKYLPRFANGEISAFALTEPDVGSDPAMMKTFAEPTDDGNYIINGTKLWCTNGPVADILIVMARTQSITVHGRERQQITAFIVETDSPGFKVEHVCRFQGLHGIKNGVISFTDVKVPAANIIGKPGMGLKIALTTLNTGRLTLPAASSAINKLCLHHCRKWANERVQWGQEIGKHQAIADKLADMAATTFATEAATWLTSAMADAHNVDIRLEAAIAKYFCTEAAWRVCDQALQIRGGRGYESSSSLRERGEAGIPIERIQRDIRINRIIEGTSEIMSLFIAREAMDVHFRNLMPLMDPRNDLGSKFKAGLKAAAFYAGWYPRQWLSLPGDTGVRHLSRANCKHLGFVRKTTKRMARGLFHAMGKHQQGLEKEQLLMFRYVDIGTELFAMTASLSMAERMLADNPADRSPQELADLFCAGARQRIADHFRKIKKNNNDMVARVSTGVLEGRYEWIETDIICECTRCMNDVEVDPVPALTRAGGARVAESRDVA